MHIAAARGDAGACRALLAAGAGTGNNVGGSPLLAAARGSFTAIVDMIIKTARLDYTPDVRLNIYLTHKLRFRSSFAIRHKDEE